MLAVFFNLHFIVFFGDRVSHWPGQQAPGITGLCNSALSLSAGITSGCCYIQLLTWVQGLTQALMLMWQWSLPMEPCSWLRARQLKVACS